VSVDGVTVLRYAGATLDEALAGENRERPSALLAERVVLDPQRPGFGKLSCRLDIKKPIGAQSSVTTNKHPVDLVLRRRGETGDWELTAEAVATIKDAAR